MRVVYGLALLVAALSCGPTPSNSTTPDEPPRGMSHAEYLQSFGPQRPADTDDADRMTLHAIDIGQGQALLLEFPCAAILVDTGGENNDAFDSTAALIAYLNEFFERRPELDRTLASLVITHPHIDHTRGIEAVLREFRISNVVTNGQDFDDLGGAPQQALHRWASKRRNGKARVGHRQLRTEDIPGEGTTGPVVDPVSGCDAAPTDPRITALWGGVGEKGFSDNANDHSVVMRVEYGDASILLTGDLEFEGLEGLSRKYSGSPEILDVDVYMVGHHGSRNSTAPHLIRAMTAKVAVISMGPYERNEDWTARRFGHPNIRAIDMLRDSRDGISWYRPTAKRQVGVSGAWKERKSVFKEDSINRAIFATGWDGSVRVHMYGNGWIEVETERDGAIELTRN